MAESHGLIAILVQLRRTRTFAAATLDLGLPPDPDGPTGGLRLLEEFLTPPPPLNMVVLTGDPDPDNAILPGHIGAHD